MLLMGEVLEYDYHCQQGKPEKKSRRSIFMLNLRWTALLYLLILSLMLVSIPITTIAILALLATIEI